MKKVRLVLAVPLFSFLVLAISVYSNHLEAKVYNNEKLEPYEIQICRWFAHC